ncbi:DUF2073 domain-containing protein [Candidatus Woesearchaeota archaeon]|nr:MAG: DUF2073 domain-containing protein [Candidatus Woesearchaeota archaeon]
MLTLQFIPYSEIENLPAEKRIAKLLNMAKEEKIVLLEGRLKREEEAELIRRTMEEVDRKFKGIELGVVYPKKHNNSAGLKKIKEGFVNMLLGDRQGFTIVGPATIVKEIKQDPNKIQLFTKDVKRKRKR